MTNHARGEVAANIGGRAYTLVADLNALAEIEQASGKAFSDIFDGQTKKMEVALLLTCARAFARSGGASEDDISALGRGQGMDVIGQIANAVGDTISAAFFPEGNAKN